MRRLVANLIAIVESRDCGYADIPAGCIDDETESELAEFGYAIGLSDALWIGGNRIYGPESIASGNYRPHVPPSVFTCPGSGYAHIPDAHDFNFEAVLKARGRIRTN